MPRDKITWLRFDDRFDDLLLEAIRRSAPLNKLVVQDKLDIEEVREFALRAVEAALLRFADSQMSLPEDGRYDDQINKAIARVGTGPASHEQRDMLRAVFRYVHAAMKDKMSSTEAWRTFALSSHQTVDAIEAMHSGLLPLLLGDEADDNTDD